MRFAALLLMAALGVMAWKAVTITTKNPEASDVMNVMQLQARANPNMPVTTVVDFI